MLLMHNVVGVCRFLLHSETKNERIALFAALHAGIRGFLQVIDGWVGSMRWERVWPEFQVNLSSDWSIYVQNYMTYYRKPASLVIHGIMPRVYVRLSNLQLGPRLSSGLLILIPQQAPQDLPTRTLRNDIDKLNT